MSSQKPLRLLLLSYPGAGKGTLSSRLLKRMPHINYVSSGDLLRREIAIKSPLGIQASSFISKGLLLPDNMITSVIMDHLKVNSLLSGETSWLLDGFPRTIGQALSLDNELVKYNSSLNLVVEIDVPQAVILKRISSRYIHLASGRVYNLDYNPPKTPGIDDITGEPLTKRSDDTIEVVQNRLNEYSKTITPLREFYEQKGILRVVSGETSDITYPLLEKLVEKELAT
ncbi:HGL139Cp [Eremothecium sinecaudum]|uniref:GTP:AMP phosphotransferase, mitochondrial n=1 Tax=Eremothecium sinecaudum TaxID=45286 RepID=A0A109UY30_9SACH|nr:HGL139Cp [Eremothecium sinecaudum]AMD22201.1 HGL139Cp [Eremothecium sinecaudum]